MQNSSIKLTNKEFDLIIHTEYPLVKKNAIEKIHKFLFDIGNELSSKELLIKIRQTIEQRQGEGRRQTDSSHVSEQNFKISKGENYLNLPYMVLDIPKISKPSFNLLCRTMFWWGKYFSLNVFIRKEAIDLTSFLAKLKLINREDVYVLITNNIWLQDLDNSEFVRINEIENISLGDGDYIKISVKHSLLQMDDLSKHAFDFYTSILACMV